MPSREEENERSEVTPVPGTEAKNGGKKFPPFFALRRVGMEATEAGGCDAGGNGYSGCMMSSI